MNKNEIITQLQINHQQFADYINSLSNDEFIFRKENKWSAGQQADHIVRSISPVNMALGLPKIAPRLLFGKSNRPSRTFDELVQKYKDKLAKGGQASGRFVPKEISLQEKLVSPKAIMHYTNQLCNKVEKMNEEVLDTYLLPHPLLGKLTFREMLYFTAYHVQHHHEIIKRDLGK
jgi:hypothetical protein